MMAQEPPISQQETNSELKPQDKPLFHTPASAATMQSTPSIPNMPSMPSVPQNVEQVMESGSRVNRYLTDYAMASASLDRSRSGVGSQSNAIKLETARIMEQSIDPSYVLLSMFSARIMCFLLQYI